MVAVALGLALIAPAPLAMASFKQQRLAAQRTYNRTWDRVSRDFGAQGQPPPQILFQRRKTGYLAQTAAGPNGTRTIEVGRAQVKHLGSRNPVKRARAREALIHEMAHVYQSPMVFNGQWNPNNPNAVSEGITEGGAEVIARHIAKARFGIPIRYFAKDRLDAAYARGQRSKHPWIYFKRQQFGSNYGQNPQTIPWPGS